MKVKFSYYYKYRFDVIDENGVLWINKEQNNDDIYRLTIMPEMETVEDEGKFYIDGYEFIKV